jgi:RIO kinase 1
VKKAKDKFKIYKNVFDEFTLKTLFKLSSRGHFDELLSPLRIGKESNVFLADKKEDIVIVKIYRLQSCNFNRMYMYIKSDPRFQNLKKQRRLIIFKWVQREFANLTIAKKITVPKPMAFLNNVIIMESIGGNKPAPQLKDKLPKNPKKFADEIIKSVKKLYDSGLVHADLSEFNILNHNEKPYLIDFSQATTTKDSESMEYLERDLKNLSNFFKKLNVDLDIAEIKKEIIK